MADFEFLRLILSILSLILNIFVLVVLVRLLPRKRKTISKHTSSVLSSPVLTINEARRAAGIAAPSESEVPLNTLVTSVRDEQGQTWYLTDKEFSIIGRPYRDTGTLDGIELLQLIAYRDMVKNS